MNAIENLKLALVEIPKNIEEAKALYEKHDYGGAIILLEFVLEVS